MPRFDAQMGLPPDPEHFAAILAAVDTLVVQHEPVGSSTEAWVANLADAAKYAMLVLGDIVEAFAARPGRDR